MKISESLKKTFNSIFKKINYTETEQNLIDDLKKSKIPSNLPPKEEKEMIETIYSNIDFVKYLSNLLEKSDYEIPTLPSIVLKIIRLTQDPNSSFKNYSNIIKKDPSLSLKLLKIANSVLYRGASEITELDQAISRIGVSGVRSLVLTITFQTEVYSSKVSEKIAYKLWRESLLSAMISGQIDKYKGLQDPMLYTVSLLSNVGSLFALKSASIYRKDKKLKHLPEDKFLLKVSEVFEKRLNRTILTNWEFNPGYIYAVNNKTQTKDSGDDIVSKIIFFSHQISKAVLSKELNNLTKEEKFLFYEDILSRSGLDMFPHTANILITNAIKEYKITLDSIKE